MWHDIRTLNAGTRVLLGLTALLLLAAGVWWLAQRPMFTLRVIRIEPAVFEAGQGTGQGPDGAAADAGAGGAVGALQNVNALTVRGTAVPRIRGNFFTTNLEAARHAFEAVPWVRRAEVRREWPDTLVVGIEEHEALGAWGDEGELISTKGELFTANLAEAETEDGQELPEFSGPPGSEAEVTARFFLMRRWLAAGGLAPRSLQLSERYAWTLKLANGVTVELGRDEGSASQRKKVERLVAAWPQLSAMLPDRIDSIDMRYPNGMALRQKATAPDTAVAAAASGKAAKDGVGGAKGGTGGGPKGGANRGAKGNANGGKVGAADGKAGPKGIGQGQNGNKQQNGAPPEGGKPNAAAQAAAQPTNKTMSKPTE